MNKEKFKRIEQLLLAAGILMVILVAVSVLYSLGFISSNLIHALGTGGAEAPTKNFDLQGFNELDIQIRR